MKRSQLDIENAVSFIYTLLKNPDIYDWGKLIQVLQFLSKTIEDNNVIGSENIYEVLTYVDVSYATYNGIRGHTGGCMKFGWGLICEKSSKQKLNTKISTESEVVGASEYIPMSIWLAMYM